MNHTLTCSFLGLGLIGGSIARALRQYHPDIKIKVYDKDLKSLSFALNDLVATSIYTEITEELCRADIIFLCAPVSINVQMLKTLTPYLSKDTILTDVGSVKSDIHLAIESLGLEDQFIGGHPMTGSERFGYVNSKSSLLENAYYILTPTSSAKESDVTLLHDLVTSIKALPFVLPFERHDHMTAGISHLPHIIASSLVNLVKDSDSEDHLMKTFAAGGFKDITRIASANATMWQQICISNSTHLQDMLSRYIASLQKILKDLEENHSLNIYNMFETSREYRDSFESNQSGAITRNHSITIEIPDKPGSLAEITALFAEFDISIKNLNIIHNRESEFGALFVEFYTDMELLKAVELLQKNNYTSYMKRS